MRAREVRAREVLEHLEASPGSYVSGAEIAAALGISRNAVSKRVAALRGRGWQIDARTHRGYLLVAAPDPVDAASLGALLRTRWLGRERCVHLREVGSTNDEVAALARAGGPHGALIFADLQRAGRGRLGRPWHSPAGDNLYLSVLLRPELAPSAAPPLSLAAAVAVADAVSEVTAGNVRPIVKWPNDLLLEGRKVAGILIELSAELDRIRHVVVGVGLNVNGSAVDLPREFRARATSIAEHHGQPLPRVEVLATILSQLEDRFDQLVADGPAGIISDWLGYADWLGEQVVVRTGQGEVRGTAVGLDATGALVLRDDKGKPRSILAGDVSLVGASS